VADSAHSQGMTSMRSLKILALLWSLTTVCPAQEAPPVPADKTPLLLGGQHEPTKELAQLNPAEMNKTGMLPPYTKVLGERAASAFGKGDWITARKAYEEMLGLDEGNALVWANLGAVEQQAGNVKRALECFEKSVSFNPQLAQSWTALGLLLQQQGDAYRAISCFARAVHEDPEDARAHNFLAITVKELGWADAAETELQKAIELKPDYGIAHFNMALMLLERRPPSIELARRHYATALELGVVKDDVVERRLNE
jgi:tetratricopeptide (TPR) repeat protein